MRQKASDEIERLLAFLDASDPYVTNELEDEHDCREPDGDDEPSLGFLNQTCPIPMALSGGIQDDLEHEHDGGERALGSVAAQAEENQERWTAGNRTDIEDQCEDEGVTA